MRKLIIILCYAAMILIIGLLIFPPLYWRIMPDTKLAIVILDKTVPSLDFREHSGIMWALNHYKITNKADGGIFNYDRDYYGFIPKSDTEYSINELTELAEKPDLIYLADSYGVYEDDYFKQNIQGSKSELIYGGLTEEEISTVMKGLGDGNTIIGEFNIASSPTSQVVREEVGGIFGVEWKGWNGRYFEELRQDFEIPVWMAKDYEKQYNKPWSFKGPGIVLIAEDGRLVVLEKNKHLGKNNLQLVYNADYQTEFNVADEVSYYYWFEILEAMPGRETIADYRLDLTAEGQAVIDSFGIPNTFPAIIRYKNTQYTSYYYAGDFADFKQGCRWWNVFGFAELRKFFSFDNVDNNEMFYWKDFVPMQKKIFSDIKIAIKQEKKEPQDGILYSRVNQKNFQVRKDETWADIFIKGVNIGPAIPGKWFTEFPKDERVYLEWFDLIAKMNANTIRIYTLLPPQFYNALNFYNQENPDNKLLLFQEIWPEEKPPDEDYLADEYQKSYLQEIEYVIDAVHGKANIAARKGRAYGVYTSDISRYVVGYLVGRELEPDEVIGTNLKNSGFSFDGKYLSSTEKASATEAWLAQSCDYVLNYEETLYNMQHPAGIVSWPTLDPVEHDSEWDIHQDKTKEYNDKIAIDINNIETKEKLKAGFFGAYHIYPNYPDFMNNEAMYNEYQDDEGRLRYGGYLKEFIENHQKYPALVAEFGLATGMGNAHSSPDGYNHGGKTEVEQGEGIVRMMKAIADEGYAGGLIFEWIDEWAKKTWITEPYMIPYERHVFWHNAIDPEQNYGLLAMEPVAPEVAEPIVKGQKNIKSIALTKNEAFLYLDIVLDKPIDFADEKLIIGIDTYDRNRGEFKYLPCSSLEFPSGMEFIIELKNYKEAKILVQPQYNIAKNKYASIKSSSGEFEEIRPLINKSRVTKDGQEIKAVYQDGSNLNYGEFDNNNHNSWYWGTENDLHFRIPWGKINFADPSMMSVLDDTRINISNPLTDELTTIVSEGIVVAPAIINQKLKQVHDMLTNLEKPLIWESWEQPRYKMRIKDSYPIISEYFKKIK